MFKQQPVLGNTVKFVGGGLLGLFVIANLQSCGSAPDSTATPKTPAELIKERTEWVRFNRNEYDKCVTTQESELDKIVSCAPIKALLDSAESKLADQVSANKKAPIATQPSTPPAQPLRKALTPQKVNGGKGCTTDGGKTYGPC